MKKIGTLILVSALGGIITLGAYKMFYEDKRAAIEQQPVRFSENPVINVSNPITVPIDDVDFTYAAEKTIDAVVHVKNTTISRGYTTLEDLIFGRPSQRAQIGTGSGVIISPDGFIITNNHVIEGAQTISITTNDNVTMEAELIGTDPKTDIALLKVDYDEDLPFTTFGDSDNARIGEWVLAVGNPFNLTSTVTAGIISAKSRDLSGRNTQSFIQTDAAVNQGNSGGALVNTNGELIGINTAITSQTGSYVGYSFAVPSNIARKVIQDIMEFGNVQNGILGVTGQELDSRMARINGIGETEGFLVSSVEAESGAERAGIQTGDIIKKLDNIEINKFSDMKGFLSAKRPDDVVNVTLLRDGEKKVLPVKLVKNRSFI
ncbi:MAG: trypsin-like peptidase domain-containing protein, partial [Bacteroidia bacterium]|nr:trypsin-like peptidase domain-containing protein [Bacteroidia bacterium]